jgi:hypothetical protein
VIEGGHAGSSQGSPQETPGLSGLWCTTAPHVTIADMTELQWLTLASLVIGAVEYVRVRSRRHAADTAARMAQEAGDSGRRGLTRISLAFPPAGAERRGYTPE